MDLTIFFFDENGEHEYAIESAEVCDGNDEATYEIRSADGKAEILLSTCDKKDSHLVLYAK